MFAHSLTLRNILALPPLDISPDPHAMTYAFHCITIHSNVPVLIHTGPASGNPHLVVPKTTHSDVKCANATAYAHMAN
jgi:hypothetical protein